LALPTLPRQLIEATYQYVVYGKLDFIKRRILDFVNQRGLVDEYAEYVNGQYAVPVNSVWTTAFPDLYGRKNMGALLEKAYCSPTPPFQYAFNCVKNLTDAFEKRYHDAFPANQPFIRAARVLLEDDYSNDEIIHAITKNMSSNIVGTRDGARVFMASDMIGDSDVLLVEFTKRRSADPFFLRFEVGDDNVYHLQFFA
jgi:hypothetical protein